MQCAVILRDFGRAVGWVSAALNRKSLTEAAQIFLIRLRADVYSDWLVFLEREKKDEITARFAVLELAMGATPNDARLLSRMVSFTDPKSEEGAKVRKMLQAQIVEGRNVGIAHFTLGNFAWAEGKQEIARVHWEQALERMPNTALISNNLAWALAINTSLDLERAMQTINAIAASVVGPLAVDNGNNLERALSLINEAIKQVPNATEFYHTRGNILIRMGRWKEAVRDLEISLNGRPQADRGAVHANLALAYDKLGAADMAAGHRAKAAEMRKP